MNVVVFASGSGTNLEAILRHRAVNEHFQVKAVVCDRQCRALNIAKNENIPAIYVSFQKFKQQSSLPDHELRVAFEERIIRELEELDFEIHLVFLAGYMRIVHQPLLSKFSGKILNVHPADLTILNEKGERRYTGDNAIFDALNNGETKTRSTVHLVNEIVDGGEIILQGPWVEYTEGLPITQEKANKHQSKQKQESDWPAVTQAIDKFSKAYTGSQACAVYSG